MKWEYYMESFTGTIDGGKMNQLGVSRWELTAVTSFYGATGGTLTFVLFFKRELIA
jgi:hypothetical protein